MLSGGCRGGGDGEGFWRSISLLFFFVSEHFGRIIFSFIHSLSIFGEAFRRLGIPPSHCGSLEQNFFRKANSILCEDLAVHVSQSV